MIIIFFICLKFIYHLRDVFFALVFVTFDVRFMEGSGLLLIRVVIDFVPFIENDFFKAERYE